MRTKSWWVRTSLVAALLVGCQSETTLEPTAPPAQIRELPAGWDSGDTGAFEALIHQPPWTEPLEWSEPARSVLFETTLEDLATPRSAELAVRAALLMALDKRPSTAPALLARLERRLPAQARGRAAVDIVCARALGRRAELEPALRGNLRALAIGPYPHPELDVRVECARAYLEPMDKTLRPIALSARPVLRFLVRVLRAETPAERNDPPDWKRVETIAWPKTRAADALVQWLADPAPYTADASWGDQNRWAERALHELGLEP